MANQTQPDNSDNPRNWYMRSQWFIGAAKVITSNYQESIDDVEGVDKEDFLFSLDAYKTVPWLSFMAIELVLKGLLTAKGISFSIKNHELKKLYKKTLQAYPKIKQIQDLEFFINNYSDYVFSVKGGNRYPEKESVPIFDHYYQVAEKLRQFAKKQ